MNKEELYKELKRQILNEDIAPGTWLVERDISIKNNISRTPVREIFRDLVSDGLMIHEPGKGYSVMKLDLNKIVEVFHTREALEGMASRLACLKADAKFLNRIAEVKKLLEKVDIDSNPIAGGEIGHRLHDLIIEGANNSIITDFYDKLSNLATLTRNISKRSIALEKKSRNEHIALTNAILDKNEMKSEDIMRRHISSTCMLVTQCFLSDQLGMNSNLNISSIIKNNDDN